MKRKNRENNFDLLRILSAVAVISLHVTSLYIYAKTDSTVFGELYSENFIITSIYSILSRFAVPCFLMISGAFILSDNKNRDYKFFYNKTFNKVGIHIFIFTIIYSFYKFLIASNKFKSLLSIVKSILLGLPFYHMWYMYILIIIYLLVPITIRFKDDIGERNFAKISICFLIVAMLSMCTSTHTLQWDLGFSFCYFGYFMIGYVVRKKYLNNSNNLNAVVSIVVGFVILLLTSQIDYIISKKQIFSFLSFKLVEPFSPLILLASVIIFKGFAQLRINIKLESVSKYMFYVYLIHALIWEILKNNLIIKIGLIIDSKIIIPICIVVVFLVSLICAIFYDIIWNFIDSKFQVSNFFSKLVK